MSCAPLDAGFPVRIVKKGSAFYAAIDGSAVFGSGATCEDALDDLDRQHRELSAFADATGLPIATLVGPGGPPRPAWTSQVRTAAIVIACFGLMMVPLSYGLSIALERTAANLSRDFRQSLRQLEADVVSAADPD